MRTRWQVALLLAAGIAAGALRDFLFVNLNYQIDHLRRSTSTSYAHSRFQAWVSGWGLNELNLLKWGLAAAFVMCMWLLCMWLLRATGAHARLAKPVSLLFLLLGTGALLCHVLSRWIPVEEASVNLLHAIQYPVLLLVLLVALIVFPGVRSGQPPAGGSDSR